MKSSRWAHGYQVEPSKAGSALAGHVFAGDESHSMGDVGVEIDPRDVARTGFVPLEQEVGPVVVVRIGALLVPQDEVGILVGLGLVGLDIRAARQRHEVGPVVVVAVEHDRRFGILQPHRAGGAHDLGQLRRQHVRLRDARRLGVRGGDVRDLGHGRRRTHCQPARENGCEHRRTVHGASSSTGPRRRELLVAPTCITTRER